MKPTSTTWCWQSTKCTRHDTSCASSIEIRHLSMDAQRKPHVVASVEARMRSSRLPGKMLSDIEGRPALLRLLDRLRQAKTLDAIVVATTVNAADDPLVHIVEAAGIRCYRGSEEDVLKRVVEAHRIMGTEL